ncbi:LOW QUALITY PROTEIN: U3 small nucleolar RNA-associated protein 25 homolog [Sceloporus undulatus]|uniref:LOW QUALITY PROTEIN: U3 small nucleolar RNA-associated protein 25 homolog n=1 Tax=Sceloporus undulatus TaxID=8520 RepID=UPI001C4B8274|nr:LOW QUALITY PROTEIN: U3 small nucleolar RNA-associated protein 25 homolog [Sceloporus undulatus]
MGKRKARRQEQISALSKKQKKHLKDFGEEHPFYDQDSGKDKPAQICELSENSEQSSSESDVESDSEPTSVYHKLLATLKTAPDSDNEEEDDDSEEESDKDDTEVDSEEVKNEGETEDEENENSGAVQESGNETSPQKNSQEKPGGLNTSTDLKNEVVEEFTDVQHEAEFSLETNFIEEESGDARADPKEGHSSVEVMKDPCKCHLDEDLEEKEIDKILARSKITSQVKWPALGQLFFSSMLERFGTIKPNKDIDLKQLHLHKPLASTWPKVNSLFLSVQPKLRDQLFTPLQKELFDIMNSYKDLFYPERTALRNGEEVRHVYCLHALNHVLKANAQVLSNNAKRRDQKPGTDDDCFRDQGLTRPKVLVVVPFRESALRVVHILIGLLESASQKKIDVSNKKRFKGEFGSDPEEKPPNLKRPEDYEAVFAGNIDDHFRIGVAILQKSMRLYAPFYSSDIIIASPLGLRTVIGAEGEKNRDYDFLSSIEILIIDEVDIYLMQNWEHVLHLINHLNQLPLESHGVDFSRVRMLSLNNWSKYYRQTLLFSGLQDPQINSVFNKHCYNYRGQVAVRNAPLTGSISHVVVQLPHVFRKLEAENSVSVIDARFHFFIDKVLPEYRDAVMSHTLIYVPSYFDYVRLRNYFKKEELNFTHVCEYTSKSSISRARHFFLKGNKQFLIFTERFHFYKRYSIRGIRNLIFYELPTYPHFYSEVCNMMKLAGSGEESALTCTVLYSKYDAQRLASVVGVERAAQMLQSSKNVHLFVTGETE